MPEDSLNYHLAPHRLSFLEKYSNTTVEKMCFPPSEGNRHTAG